ncbi:MAG TPA: YdcF family protein, partial [Polyangiaceae bacterium]|nr:YdcF family protein [Polyangiaceae bacterium]
MFFFLSKTLDALLSPLTWSVVLIAIGLFWPGPSIRRRLCAVAGLAVLLLFSFEPLANALERTLERSATRTYRADIVYDAVILLGGVVDRSAASGEPSYNDNVERLIVTYDLLRTNHARRVIVSGGVLDPAAPNLVEAEVLARQLVDWGIARDRITIEPHSRNTYENAVESRRIAEGSGWTRLLIVTSAFHMPRALGCFRAVGLAVDTLPVDYRAYDPARFSGS